MFSVTSRGARRREQCLSPGRTPAAAPGSEGRQRAAAWAPSPPPGPARARATAPRGPARSPRGYARPSRGRGAPGAFRPRGGRAGSARAAPAPRWLPPRHLSASPAPGAGLPASPLRGRITRPDVRVSIRTSPRPAPLGSAPTAPAAARPAAARGALPARPSRARRPVAARARGSPAACRWPG